MSEVDGAGVLKMRGAVGVDRVGMAAPSLDASGDVGGVRGAVDADRRKIAETVGEAAEELIVGVGEANRGEDAGAKHWIAGETVEEGVLGAFDVACRVVHVT